MRNISVLLAAATLAGCSATNPIARGNKNPPVSLNDRPVVNDPAMQTRDWDRSTSYYSNGSTIAGPTGFYYTPNPAAPQLEYSAVQIPLFVGQTIFLPAALIIDPPTERVRSSGSITEPTFTANPALPPSKDPAINAEQNVPPSATK